MKKTPLPLRRKGSMALTFALLGESRRVFRKNPSTGGGKGKSEASKRSEFGPSTLFEGKKTPPSVPEKKLAAHEWRKASFGGANQRGSPLLRLGLAFPEKKGGRLNGKVRKRGPPKSGGFRKKKRQRRALTKSGARLQNLRSRGLKEKARAEEARKGMRTKRVGERTSYKSGEPFLTDLKSPDDAEGSFCALTWGGSISKSARRWQS